MLLTTAAVYQCDLHGHCVGETPVPVAEVSTGTAAAALLRSAARWMTPFSPHEWTDPVIGDTGHLSGVRSPGNWVR
jgi:hypothetical protein